MTSECGSETEHESKVEMAAGAVAGQTAGGTKKDRVIGNGLKNGVFIENGKKVCYKDDEKLVDTPKTTYQEQMLNKIIDNYENPEVVLKDPGIKVVYSALGEVGFEENLSVWNEEKQKFEGDNKTPFNDWYYGEEKYGTEAAWCAAFVQWNSYNAGLMNGENFPKEKSYAGVYNFAQWYNDRGRFFDADSDYVPKTGDLSIEYHWNEKQKRYTGHMGIVYAYDPKENVVYTVEGNTDDQVYAFRKRSLDTYLTGTASTGGSYQLPIPEEQIQPQDFEDKTR